MTNFDNQKLLNDQLQEIYDLNLIILVIREIEYL